MEIIKDNYNKKKLNQIVCDKCLSELMFDESDIRHGSYGVGEITCPLCGNVIEETSGDYDLKLTKDNLQYPIHYHHTSSNDGAVHLTDEEVNNYVKKYIDCLNSDDDYFIGHITGDLLIAIARNNELNEFEIYVCRDFYSTYVTCDDNGCKLTKS